MGWTDVATGTLRTIRGNLLRGLVAVHAHMIAGTVHVIQPGKSSSPAHAGYITLILLDGVEAELARREAP